MALRVLVSRAGYQGSRSLLAAGPLLGKEFTWFRDGLDGQLYHTVSLLNLAAETSAVFATVIIDRKRIY